MIKQTRKVNYHVNHYEGTTLSIPWYICWWHTYLVTTSIVS